MSPFFKRRVLPRNLEIGLNLQWLEVELPTEEEDAVIGQVFEAASRRLEQLRQSIPRPQRGLQRGGNIRW